MIYEGIIAGKTPTCVYGCYQSCLAIRRLAAWVEEDFRWAKEDFRRWWSCAAKLPTLPKVAPLLALSGQC